MYCPINVWQVIRRTIVHVILLELAIMPFQK
jgi:hypothetical protein